MVEDAEPEPDPEFRVWPENWDTICLFLAMQSQWRHSTGGIAGLDYSVLPIVAAGLGLRWREQFEKLQIVEFAALQALHEKR